MRPVYSAPTLADATVICGFLLESGIDAVIVNDDQLAGGDAGFVYPAVMPTVLVPDGHAERAIALIEERSGWFAEEEWGDDDVRAIDADEGRQASP
ncbi:MAG: hypothetical protein JRF61_09810 [Deltaproteobacteria bacterium]|nr:hypothetical protein [Deltaproteobacteria bacterium]